MEDDPIQANERRMQKFNLIVIAAALTFLGIDHSVLAILAERPTPLERSFAATDWCDNLRVVVF